IVPRHGYDQGCDTGFGFLTALDLARDGFHVFAGCLTDRGIDALKLEAKKRQIAEQNITAFRLDVTKEEDAKRCWEMVRGIDGGLFALVNNVSTISSGKLVHSHHTCANLSVLSSLVLDLHNTHKAGIGGGIFLDMTPVETFEKVFAVNTFGAVR
ncbi:hypothetical protein HDU93_007453, partial [Gonapodya sp. JEL0774]